MIHGLKASGVPIVIADLARQSIRDLVLSHERKRVGIVFTSLAGLSGDTIALDVSQIDDLDTQSLVVCDECHSFGSIGAQGFEYPYPVKPHLRICGLSKAIGCMGAAVCGDREILEVIRQCASPWIFSTAVPPMIWRITETALQLAFEMESARKRIRELAAHFRKQATTAGINVAGTEHISSILFHDVEPAIMVQNRLRSAGILAKASLPPSRPADSTCMRITFSPQHTFDDITRLIQALTET